MIFLYVCFISNKYLFKPSALGAFSEPVLPSGKALGW